MDWVETIAPWQAVGILFSGWFTAVSMFGFLWRAIARGKLRTEREFTELRTDRDKSDAKADTWRQAWQERERTQTILIQQNAKLMAISEVSTHVLESLPKPGGQA